MTDEAGAAPAAAEPSATPAPAPEAQQEVVSPPEPIDHQPEPREPKEEPAKEEGPKQRPPVGDAIKKAREKVEARDKEKGEKAGEGTQRGEDGRFAPKEPAKGEAEAKPVDKAEKEGQPPAKVEGKPEAQTKAEQVAPERDQQEQRHPENSPHREPPRGFDETAKADWEKTPESVRGASHRRIRELEQGIEKHQAESARLKPYREVAEKVGTTVEDALGRYMGLERELSQGDLRGALEKIAAYVGVSRTAKPLTFTQLAHSMLGTTPEEKESLSDQQSQATRQTIANLEQKIARLEASNNQQAESEAEQLRQQFAADHPRYAEEKIQKAVTMLLKSEEAADAEEAYEMACRLHPGASTTPNARAQTPSETIPPDAEAQTLSKGSKSISGAPSSGAQPPKRKSASSIRDAIVNADKRLRVG